MKTIFFSAQSTAEFSDISGDYNPIHIHSVAGRRSFFGGTVVHGIHILLKGADLLFEASGTTFFPRRVKASFVKPVETDSEVVYSWEIDCRSLQVKMVGKCKGAVVFRALFMAEEYKSRGVDGSFERTKRMQSSNSFSAEHAGGTPREFDEYSLNGVRGFAELGPTFNGAANFFPNLTSIWSREAVAGMLLTTNIVGMHAPGLYSVFSNIDFFLEKDSKRQLPLGVAEYAVSKVTPAIRRCEIAAVGNSWSADLVAFVRPKPVQQLSYSEIVRRVSGAKFSGQRALVVGGSRGLGEVAAKILAADGARVALTYASSKTEAEAVVADIVTGGGLASAHHHDVHSGITNEFRDLLREFRPTHVFYFATPALSGAKLSLSSELFDRYINFYINHFSKLIIELESSTRSLRNIFWPSSVAISEVPSGMLEYAMAKAAGEVFCEGMRRAFPDIVIHSPRLPRVRTDLTATPLNSHGNDAFDVLVACFDELSVGQG